MDRSLSVLREPEFANVEFLAGVIDHIAHPIFVKDRSFRFVLLNRALCEMVGHGRDALLGKTDHDFFPREEADFFRAKDIEMFATGATVRIDQETITDAVGVRHVLATTKVPLRSASGEVTHLVGIIHDITALKAAEETLRLRSEALEARVKERTIALDAAQSELVRRERLAVLGQLAGGLAHQIRNPLAAITNAAYVVQRTLARAAAGSDATQAIGIILEEAWRANRIITDLLEYARVRAPDRRACDARTLVEEALASQPLRATIAVRRSFDDVPPALCDAEQIRDALENLIRNAAEAMPGGGTLEVGVRTDGGEIVITIGDSGPGVAGEVKDHLFEPLVTTKPLGFGLGLTTTRALVQNQGGSIACESVPGKGTRFDVKLPIDRA